MEPSDEKKTFDCWNCHTKTDGLKSPMTGIIYCTECGAVQSAPSPLEGEGWGEGKREGLSKEAAA